MQWSSGVPLLNCARGLIINGSSLLGLIPSRSTIANGIACNTLVVISKASVADAINLLLCLIQAIACADTSIANGIASAVYWLENIGCRASITTTRYSGIPASSNQSILGPASKFGRLRTSRPTSHATPPTIASPNHGNTHVFNFHANIDNRAM